MRKLKFKIPKRVKLIVMLSTVVCLIGFTEISVSDVTCNKVVISIHNTASNHFVSDQDILDLMEKGEINLIGSPLGKLDLKALEKNVLANRYIESCDIYKDIKGIIYVNTTLLRPVARIMQRNGPGAYITSKGDFLPLSRNYSARVMILSGDFTKQLMSVDFDGFNPNDDLLQMINYIDRDPFWRAQIAQLDVDALGNISMLPQVTRQLIDFGSANGYQEKFRKLTIFYKEVLPRKGWNSYTSVNIKFDNQIIAE